MTARDACSRKPLSAEALDQHEVWLCDYAKLHPLQAELAAGKAALAGAEAAAGCLAMLLAAGLPSQMPSAFDASGHKDVIWSLVAVAKVGSAAGKYATAQTLAALAGLRGNRAAVVEGLLGLLYVDTAKPEVGPHFWSPATA